MGTLDEQDGCEIGQTAPIMVGGRTIGNPLTAVTDYLKEYHGFWTDRPGGVATAKISKVLYLMRPALFPILDRRLRSFYGPAAKAAARDVASRRPEFAACKRMTWEAVRLDLLSNQAALRELRGAGRHRLCPSLRGFGQAQ